MKSILLILLTVGLFFWNDTQKNLYEKKAKEHQARSLKKNDREKLLAQYPLLAQKVERLCDVAQVKGAKVAYLLETMATACQLQELNVTWVDEEDRTRCRLSAQSLSDGEIFRFIDMISTLLPPVLGVTVGQIERHHPLTNEALEDLSKGKNRTFLTTTMTIDWYYFE